jgi:hypothetical protein
VPYGSKSFWKHEYVISITARVTGTASAIKLIVAGTRFVPSYGARLRDVKVA